MSIQLNLSEESAREVRHAVVEYANDYAEYVTHYGEQDGIDADLWAEREDVLWEFVNYIDAALGDE